MASCVSRGAAGTGPGEFNTVHSVFIDHADGDKLYVADRYNNRVQFFTPERGVPRRVGLACACRRASARALTGSG